MRPDGNLHMQINKLIEIHHTKFTFRIRGQHIRVLLLSVPNKPSKTSLIISGRFKCEQKYEEEAERLKIPLSFHHISRRRTSRSDTTINRIFTFSFIYSTYTIPFVGITQAQASQGVQLLTKINLQIEIKMVIGSFF